MATKLVLRSNLGLESDHLYTVTFVSAKTTKLATVSYGDNQLNQPKVIGEIYSGLVWRAELTSAESWQHRLQILLDEQEAAKSGVLALVSMRQRRKKNRKWPMPPVMVSPILS
ncbi:MAG: hypothetical protein U5L01_04165 [Rheinheimera sp.]|nr:hypothetical protein [Rheinheimera sp.]